MIVLFQVKLMCTYKSIKFLLTPFMKFFIVIQLFKLLLKVIKQFYILLVLLSFQLHVYLKFYVSYLLGFYVEFKSRYFVIPVEFCLLSFFKFIISSFKCHLIICVFRYKLISILERINFIKIVGLYIFQLVFNDLTYFFIFFNSHPLNFLNILLILIDIQSENFSFPNSIQSLQVDIFKRVIFVFFAHKGSFLNN